jgi:hypothetical protein
VQCKPTFLLSLAFLESAGDGKEMKGWLALRVHGKDGRFSVRQGMMVRGKKRNSSDPRTLGRKGMMVLVFAAARVLSAGH